MSFPNHLQTFCLWLLSKSQYEIKSNKKNNFDFQIDFSIHCKIPPSFCKLHWCAVHDVLKANNFLFLCISPFTDTCLSVCTSEMFWRTPHIHLLFSLLNRWHVLKDARSDNLRQCQGQQARRVTSTPTNHHGQPPYQHLFVRQGTTSSFWLQLEKRCVPLVRINSPFLTLLLKRFL